MNLTCSSSELLQMVSRSFALCIPMLEENKSGEVENTYLLSRIADTIEDSSLSAGRKKALFERFFETFENKDAIDDFVDELRSGTIDEHDKALCNAANYRLVLSTFHFLDPGVQKISLSMLREMASGMAKYLEKEIEDFSDLDEYCYYVAGTVGIYLNNLLELKDGVKLDDEKAIALGRYLQKVNIIKNYLKDTQEGRIFWPSYLLDGMNPENNLDVLEKMITNAQKEAQPSFEYAASIPYSLPRYRKFVSVLIMMATENLKLMRNSREIFTNPVGVKIPRSRMPEIIGMAQLASVSNDALWEFMGKLEKRE